MPNVIGESAEAAVAGVLGRNTDQGNVLDPANPSRSGNSVGVQGVSANGIAVLATSESGKAILAISNTGPSMEARSKSGIGLSVRSEQNIAVSAAAEAQVAVHATSDLGSGVRAESKQGVGVEARSDANWGLTASSNKQNAIHATAISHSSIYAVSERGSGIEAISNQGTGIYAKGINHLAGYFEGAVHVTGDVSVAKDVKVAGDVQLVGADCAEDFEVYASEDVKPGAVMVIGSDGVLRQSTKAYDKRVAGVVSGAGDLKPALRLDRQADDTNRLPIALFGKVYCWVDADRNPIQVGDLLTTSDTPAHAMKVADPTSALGSVIGKAMRALPSGRDLIPILVSLQ